MLFATVSAQDKRAQLRKKIKNGKLLRFPGAFAPVVALLIEDLGFDGVYISGAVLSHDFGLPDIGLTTLSEISERGRTIARVTKLPAIIDIDTGFGEPMNVARTVCELEELGLCGCHIEDQVNPKRCGHLDHKEVVDISSMTKKIKAAVEAKTDKNFLVTARTDARSIEGLEQAIDRAKAYADAGADMIFPEALKDEKEFEAFRKAVKVPLLANMTEFGKSKLLNYETLNNLGYNIVIYPVTGLRLAMKAVEDGFKEILDQGSQEGLLEKMLHRKRLYQLLKYEEYAKFDDSVYNFKL